MISAHQTINAPSLKTTVCSFLLSVVGACAVLLPVAAWAEHEVDHRYNVTGFVLDGDGQPVADSAVSIRMGNNTIGTQTTNPQGYYNIRLHLHDEDLGQKLVIQSGTDEVTITVTLTPGDNATSRIHYANLVGGRLVEEPLSKPRYAVWVYVTPVAVVLVLSLAYVIEQRRKRARKRQLAKGRQTKKGRRQR